MLVLLSKDILFLGILTLELFSTLKNLLSLALITKNKAAFLPIIKTECALSP